MISVFPERRQDTAFLVENSRAKQTHLAINLILKSAYRRHLRSGFGVRRLQRWVSSRNLGHGFRKGAHESRGQWLGQHAQIFRMMPVAIHIIHGHRGSLEESRRKSLKSLHILLKKRCHRRHSPHACSLGGQDQVLLNGSGPVWRHIGPG